MNPALLEAAGRFNRALNVGAAKGESMAYWRKARGTFRAASARPGMRAGAALAALSIVLGVAVAIAPATAKDDYATYADVLAAKASVAKTAALIKKIEAGIAALEKKVEITNAAAVAAGDAANTADENYQTQSVKTTALQAQADQGEKDAAVAKARAGALLVQKYRQSGNTDTTIDLLLHSSDSKDILYSLGMSETLVEQSQGIFDAAVQAENTAQSLSDQAKVAENELAKLKTISDAALAVANDKAQAAAAALQEEQDNISAQQELLAAAKSKVATTQADYQKGVEAREKARQAALAAAGGVGPNVSVKTPLINGAWALPEYGNITSGFGFRLYPYRSFHLGTDIGAACGTQIFAAHAGTVSYAGWNGIYGNFIRIDLGQDGVQNEYGHILMGGLKVRVGDTVSAGQVIALVGKTGGATGCHLHFGVRINGLVTDPVPFMHANGINLG
jgi:murein DD-endopeptidase MepM/ murein hydrolase activator NlpD